MSETPPPPPPPQQPNAAPPGWYPTSPGYQQYWDGSQWTGHVAPVAAPPPPGGLAPSQAMNQSDEKTWAVLMHLSVFLLWFIGPLVVYLVKKDESPFLRSHAAAALNLQISLFIAAVVSFVLILVLIGIFMLLAVALVGVVLPIVGAVRAGRGDVVAFGVPSFVS